MNTLLQVLGRLDRAHIEFDKVLLAILSVVVSLLMVLEIVTRFVFRSPLFGLEEITLICIMWLYMIGAVVASHKRAHLDAEMMALVTRRKRVLAVARASATLLTLVISAFVLAWSHDLLIWGLEKQQGTPVFRIPWVVSQSSLFFASVMFVAYLLRDLIRDVRSVVRAPRPWPLGSQDAEPER